MDAEVNKQVGWAESFGLRLRKKFEASEKLGKTTRFVVSSQIWLKTIPTRNCDVLVTLPGKTDDTTLMWLLSKIRNRMPSLIATVRHHTNTGVFGIYLTCSTDNLLRGAEELALRKNIKKEFDGGQKEFVYCDREFFEGIEDPKHFLTTQERQSIVMHMLCNVRAHSGEKHGNIKFLEGQPIFPKLASKKIIKNIIPLHATEDLRVLRKSWVQALCSEQPLDSICDYFGVKIAFYFAYLGHYTRALVFPALLGIFLWCLSDVKQSTNDHCFVVFSCFNVIWATLYLEHWKRRSAEQAYHWGTLDHQDELLEEPRPLYHGNPVVSRVTGRIEPYYPEWKRRLFFYFVTVPVITLCLGVVFVVMWCIFDFQDWLNGKVKEKDLSTYLKFLPKILLALSIGILDEVYKKIAQWLNARENHRLEESYQNNLIIKLVLFQFVNSFLSLFYLAFYIQDMDRLKEQLATILITRQLVGNFKEALLPYIIDKLKLLRIGYNMTEDLSPGTLQKQAHEILEKQFSPKRSKSFEHTLPEGTTNSKNDNNSAEVETSNHLLEDKSKAQTSETKICHELLETCGLMNKDTRELASEPVNKETREVASEPVTRTASPEADDESDEDSEVEVEISQSGPQLTQAEYEAAMKPFEDTLEDHLEMLIQFGYVTLFSSAFPLAALCALINNVIEIRSDAFKLCMIFQRPFGQRVGNIGIWQDALEIMSVIAVMVNCALIGMSGLAYRFYPDLTAAERIVFIVILEHLVLAAKFLLAYAIPDIPLWVAEERARLEFLRREALKTVEETQRQLRCKRRASAAVLPSKIVQEVYQRRYLNQNRHSHQENNTVEENRTDPLLKLQLKLAACDDKKEL